MQHERSRQRIMIFYVSKLASFTTFVNCIELIN
jgi:hypothetical protein